MKIKRYIKLNNKVLIFGLFAILAVVVFFSFIKSTIKVKSPTNEKFLLKNMPIVIKPTPINSPDEWKTYTNSQFTFRHPAEVNFKENLTQNDQLTELIKLSFMGEKQMQSGRTQTELADGYIFVVSKLKESKSTPLAIAEERYKNTLEECLNIPNSEISKVEKINTQNLSGYTYNVKNCMGSYILNFISNNNDNYEITLFFTGFDINDETKYKKTVEQILQTFKFTN